MKANELMVGDILQNENADYVLVRSVADTAEKDFCIVEVLDGVHQGEIQRVYCDDLTPIHLTPKILELNNFKKDLDYIDTYWRQDCRKFCFVNECDDWYFAIRYKGGHICIAECNYVHELQHDLKRCGTEKELSV